MVNTAMTDVVHIAMNKRDVSAMQRASVDVSLDGLDSTVKLVNHSLHDNYWTIVTLSFYNNAYSKISDYRRNFDKRLEKHF